MQVVSIPCDGSLPDAVGRIQFLTVYLLNEEIDKLVNLIPELKHLQVLKLTCCQESAVTKGSTV